MMEYAPFCSAIELTLVETALLDNGYNGKNKNRPSNKIDKNKLSSCLIIYMFLMCNFRLSYYFGGGLNPVWFHVPNILLHAIISVLLLRVFSILFGGYQVNLDTNEVEFLAPKSSFLCATLFAVHPIHTECVSIMHC